MTKLRLYLITVILLCPLMLLAQSHDFKVQKFHASKATDLSAVSSNVKDLNGVQAALIRFAVRVPDFEFEANNGIIKIERKTGEVWLFVPQGTKRLTIRHPSLGVLRDYVLPVAIKSKSTYDAEIVITNTEYLHAMYGQGAVEVPDDGQEAVEVPDTQQDEKPVVDTPVIDAPVDPVYLEKVKEPVKEEPKEEPKEDPKAEEAGYKKDLVGIFSKNSNNVVVIPTNEVKFYAGIGFNALSVMGPSVILGISYGKVSLEGGFVYGLDKVEDIHIIPAGSSKASEVYDYSCSKAWARLGLNFDSGKLRIAPQAGVTFNMISGKATSSASNTTDDFKESYPMSVFAAVRFSYEVADHLRIHVTPQYDFNIGGDKIFDFIKKADSKLKAFGEGGGINAGIIYEF